jgi:glutamyl-tRNA reductase
LGQSQAPHRRNRRRGGLSIQQRFLNYGASRLLIVNRTFENAVTLASEVSGEPLLSLVKTPSSLISLAFS